MNLIDRYCAEVGKHLPRKGRADIEAEIRSTLEDMINDRSRERGQPADEALVSAVLKEYGAPAKVAAAYRPAPYLIGPRLYPVFELVLKIVLTVLFALALAGLGLSVIGRPSGQEFLAEAGKFGLQFFGGAVGAFGNIVLVFAILERVLPASAFEDKEQDWDPAELAQEPGPDELKRSELILSAVFTVIGLIVLNLYPNLIGLGFMTGGQWTYVRVLSPAFFSYLPWINVLGVAQIAFDLVLLTRKTWEPATRLASVALKLGGIGLAFTMLTGPSLVAVAPDAFVGTPLAAVGERLVSLASLGVMIGLTVAIIVSAIEVAQVVYRLLTRGAPPRLSAHK